MGGPKEALVTWEFWQTRLGGKTEVLNQVMEMSGSKYELVGVLPKGFRFPTKTAEMFAPAQLYEGLFQQRAARFVTILGLRRSGVSLEAAQAEVAGLVKALGEKYGKDEAGFGMVFEDSRAFFVGANTQRAIWILSGAVGLLLTIAVVNAANLMLARGIDRRRDQAVRLALGARPGRIIWDTVMEGVALSVVAAGLGALLSVWGIDAVRIYWRLLPTFRDLTLDWRVAGVSLGIACGIGILASLAPGILAARRDVLESLRGSLRTTTGKTGLRKGLVAVQIALSMVLVAGAILMGQNLRGLLKVDPGFRASGLTTFAITLPWETSFAEQIEFFRALRRNFAESPLAAKVAYADAMPGTGTSITTYRGTGEPQSVRVARVSADYFDVLGIGLKRGRLIGEQDGPKGATVAVLNEAAAALLYPGVDAVGKTLKGLGTETVIGVVAGGNWPVVYEGFQVSNWPSPSFVVEARGGQSAALLADLRQRLKRARPGQALHSVMAIEQYVDGRVAEPRLSFFLVGLFAICAGLLAFLGIYGVMSWYVSERTVEIGVRVALGARAGQVLGMVGRQGGAFVALGLVAGAGLSLAAARAAGLTADWRSVTGAGAGILILSLLAMGGPAVRAVRIEPREALRGDG